MVWRRLARRTAFARTNVQMPETEPPEDATPTSPEMEEMAQAKHHDIEEEMAEEPDLPV